MADIPAGIGRRLDEVASGISRDGLRGLRADLLQTVLERVGRVGDLLGRVRLGLLTVERAVSFFGQTLADRADPALRPLVKGLMRDLQALEVHADFLGSRLALTSDATLGMINLSQNVTVRIVSVVAALFLPPTLIASAYGMNFAHMPELAHPLGSAMALGLMLASAVGTYLVFKWKRPSGAGKDTLLSGPLRPTRNCTGRAASSAAPKLPAANPLRPSARPRLPTVWRAATLPCTGTPTGCAMACHTPLARPRSAPVS